MNEPILMARVERRSDGRIAVLSPLVGTWSDPPHAGALLGPGARVGTLQHLARRWALVLPDEASGRVAGALPRDRSVPVEYDQELLRLAPLGAGENAAADADAVVLGHPADAGLPPGARAVVSPTDGVFYRRPSPDAAPFVETGRRIRSGDPLGLVEVMKTFNQIQYGGPGFPEEAEVLEVRAGDAEEIRAGQVLVVVR